MSTILYADHTAIRKIARCHIAAFPETLSSKLGLDFVCAMMQWYLSAPNKFLFYVEENEMVQGYCGGFIIDGSDAFGSGSGMTQFGFNSAILSFMRKPWLLFHPEVRNKYAFILTNIKRKLGFIKEQPAVTTKPAMKEQPLTAGLVVIGVLPALQQKGLGTFLQQEFERKAKEMGALQLQLSVRKNNDNAIRSYQRNGFHISTETGPSYVMVKDLI
ncbi:MAG: GNAT family N-acetyltransferase [Bacteroidota bacterium]